MKTPTGVQGLDEITNGGLPRGVTVVFGEPGCGKTILSLQFCAMRGPGSSEPGIFVSFEETREDIVGTATSFGWTAADAIERETGFDPNVLVFDANPSVDLVQAGDFDLGGLLGGLGLLVEQTGAKRVVFDGIDVLLDLLDDPSSRRREMLRIRNWVRTHDITAVVTSKPLGANDEGYGFLRFMANALVLLRQRPCGRSTLRLLEVPKMRGGAHSTSPYPFVIDAGGIAIGDVSAPVIRHDVSSERASSGIAGLDDMLGGGYFAGSSVLVSGAPGTAKTTLAGSFINAACERGVSSLYVSFDEAPNQIQRNLGSIGLDLRRHSKAGRLTVLGFRTGRLGPEEQFRRLERAVLETWPGAVVIDPISGLTGEADVDLAGHLGERVIDMIKAAGSTLLVTSLLEGPSNTEERARAQISSVADSWIHLSFAARGGERNRALTIIKSRGSAHSNQVRELVLSDAGANLADLYTSEGEVLMGSARIEKEQSDRAKADAAELESKASKSEIEHAEIMARLRLEEAKAEIEALRLRRHSALEREVSRTNEKSRAAAARLGARRSGS